MWAIRADIAVVPAAAQVTTIITQLQQLEPVPWTTFWRPRPAICSHARASTSGDTTPWRRS
eukprot:9965960-Lingulodinium_polyedra.AAC.1